MFTPLSVRAVRTVSPYSSVFTPLSVRAVRAVSPHSSVFTPLSVRTLCLLSTVFVPLSVRAVCCHSSAITPLSFGTHSLVRPSLSALSDFFHQCTPHERDKQLSVETSHPHEKRKLGPRALCILFLLQMSVFCILFMNLAYFALWGQGSAKVVAAERQERPLWKAFIEAKVLRVV